MARKHTPAEVAAQLTAVAEHVRATGGSEQVFTFSDATAAKGLYGLIAKAYLAATKCPTVKQTIPASGTTPASSPTRTVTTETGPVPSARATSNSARA